MLVQFYAAQRSVRVSGPSTRSPQCQIRKTRPASSDHPGRGRQAPLHGCRLSVLASKAATNASSLSHWVRSPTSRGTKWLSDEVAPDDDRKPLKRGWLREARETRRRRRRPQVNAL